MTRRRLNRSGSASFLSAPLVAFLLIAAFGMLFTGCSHKTAMPPTNHPVVKKLDDVAFTASDLAKMQAAEGSGSSVSSASGTASGAVARATGTAAVLTMNQSSSAMSLAPIDDAQVKAYDALRATPSQNLVDAYKVTNTFVNVRAAPNSGAATVGRLDEGSLISVTDFPNADWAKIELAPGKIGYVSLKYIAKVVTQDKLAEEQKKFDGEYFVDFAFLNVRQQPNAQSPKIGQIPGRAIVKPLSMDKDWANVAIDGQSGYASTTYLTKFLPPFVVRQDNFTLPVLLYSATEPSAATMIDEHLKALKNKGITILSLRDFSQQLVSQQGKDTVIGPHSVIVGIADVSPQMAQPIADVLVADGVKPTLFVKTNDLGISGITQKTLASLLADGFDIESQTISGTDLRALTDSQIQTELQGSRQSLETQTHSTVLAVFYPQGGLNDRVRSAARAAGYLFGVTTVPQTAYSRADFLSLPSIFLHTGTTTDQLMMVVRQ